MSKVEMASQGEAQGKKVSSLPLAKAGQQATINNKFKHWKVKLD